MRRQIAAAPASAYAHVFVGANANFPVDVPANVSADVRGRAAPICKGVLLSAANSQNQVSHNQWYPRARR